MAELRTIDEEPVLRFERRFAHPQEKVWQAVTDPAELANWFPAAAHYEPEVGGAMRFTFADAPEEAGEGGSGEVTEYDPPRVFAFRWDRDVLRFALHSEGSDCLLVFTQIVGGGRAGLLTAGATAHGWDVCLTALEARLDGRTLEEPTDQVGPVERYVAAFGLDEGGVEAVEGGHRVRFARDLMWAPLDEAWSTAVDGEEPGVGAAPPLPCTNHYVPAGEVTTAAAPRTFAYAWLHEDEPVGTVSWEFTADPDLGTRVELTQTVPEHLSDMLPILLAAWHVQLELLFAAVHGDVRCPWPEERTEELRKRYVTRLG